MVVVAWKWNKHLYLHFFYNYNISRIVISVLSLCVCMCVSTENDITKIGRKVVKRSVLALGLIYLDMPEKAVFNSFVSYLYFKTLQNETETLFTKLKSSTYHF